MSEVTVIEKGKELEFFTEDKLEPFLAEIEKMVDNFEHDMTTPKGRAATRKFARQVVTFKGIVEDSGKGLVADWKKQAKAVDEVRKKSREALDVLRDRARQPLTDWEQIDKDRIALHQIELERLRNMVNVEEETAAAYTAALTTVKAAEMGKCWDEFATDAIEAKEEAIAVLEAGVTSLTKSEAEAAELKRLRKETAAREQADRDAAIAKEATEKAEREAKEAADLAAREAAEREKRLRIEKEEAEAAAKRQERERIAAEERAEVEAEDAKKREAEALEQGKRDEAARIQREKEEADREQAKLEANKRHRGKIHKQAKECFMGAGFSEADAVKVVKIISNGQIANVTINY